MQTTALSARSRRLVTLAVMGGIFLAALDLTAVGPAMPRIVAALGGGDLYAWAFAVYAVFSTTTTPVFGRLADRRGRRRVFVGGTAIFLVGSALSGAAPSMPTFLVARAVQGVGAGALLPVAFTIVGDLYDVERRARMQGTLSGVWGVASIVGPLLGGSLVETVGWRSVFYVNIPIGLLSAFVVGRFLVEDRVRGEAGKPDLAGVSIFTLSVLLLLFATELTGWLRIVDLGGAVLAGFAFVVRERRTKDPLFDLSLFRRPLYRAANTSGFFAGAVLLSLAAYVPVYVMNVRGGGAVLSGLVLAPLSLGWLLAAAVGGRLLVRRGARILVLPGLALLTLATLAISRIGPVTPLGAVLGLLFVTGLGFGLSFTVYLVAVQDEVTSDLMGQATGALQFFQQIGGALGVAALELVFLAHLSDPSLLEAAPGRLFSSVEKSQLVSGFDAAFLLAAAFGAVAFLFGLSTRGGVGSKEI